MRINMIKRKGIIIYFKHKKVVKKIKDLDINITYVNEAARYLTGYVNEDSFAKVEKILRNNRLVKKVEASMQEIEVLNIAV